MQELTEEKRRIMFFDWMDTLPKETRQRIHETNELTLEEQKEYANYIMYGINERIKI